MAEQAHAAAAAGRIVSIIFYTPGKAAETRDGWAWRSALRLYLAHVAQGAWRKQGDCGLSFRTAEGLVIGLRIHKGVYQIAVAARETSGVLLLDPFWDGFQHGEVGVILAPLGEGGHPRQTSRGEVEWMLSCFQADKQVGKLALRADGQFFFAWKGPKHALHVQAF